MKKIASWVLSILVVGTVGGAMLTSATPQTASAACGGFLGFPAWYDGLTDTDCNITSPTNLSAFIWRIAMNVVEIALVALGYICAGFILYGGFYLMTSNGKPDKAALARRMILDAAIGLGIALASIAIVNFIASNLVK